MCDGWGRACVMGGEGHGKGMCDGWGRACVMGGEGHV